MRSGEIRGVHLGTHGEILGKGLIDRGNVLLDLDRGYEERSPGVNECVTLAV
jgi:hypothetical protein